MRKLLLLLWLVAVFCFAETPPPKRLIVDPPCPEHFFQGKSPAISEEMSGICLKFMAIGYFTEHEIPVWSAEHLTIQRLLESKRKKGSKLYNVSGQDKAAWEYVEAAVHRYAYEQKSLYVITGFAFKTGERKPTLIYKAIYDPINDTASAYVVTSVGAKEYQTLSIKRLEELIGYVVFPTLPDNIKQKKIILN